MEKNIEATIMGYIGFRAGGVGRSPSLSVPSFHRYGGRGTLSI